ncbi:MAG TPA: YoaK family protein [Candidatus Baltobacteraceae bacterium]|nr:YoaK family protein [Candidatus Baltobacteraceae bacterium]
MLWLALALAAIAGAVDGIGYLLLYHVFTSHMSGNTVVMMIHVANGDWREAWRHVEPIVIFFFGIVAGIALTDMLSALRVARMFSVIAGLEFVLLAAFLALAHPPQQWMVVWPASAMGVQNAMLRRVGRHRVRTTFVTGMLTNAAQHLVETLQALATRSGEARKKARDFAFYGGIWVCFAGGGILAAFITIGHGTVALLLPLSGLAALIAYDLFAPLANEPVEEASAG